MQGCRTGVVLLLVLPPLNHAPTGKPSQWETGKNWYEWCRVEHGENLGKTNSKSSVSTQTARVSYPLLSLSFTHTRSVQKELPSIAQHPLHSRPALHFEQKNMCLKNRPLLPATSNLWFTLTLRFLFLGKERERKTYIRIWTVWQEKWCFTNWYEQTQGDCELQVFFYRRRTLNLSKYLLATYSNFTTSDLPLISPLSTKRTNHQEKSWS